MRDMLLLLSTLVLMATGCSTGVGVRYSIDTYLVPPSKNTPMPVIVPDPAPRPTNENGPQFPPDLIKLMRDIPKEEAPPPIEAQQYAARLQAEEELRLWQIRLWKA